MKILMTSGGGVIRNLNTPEYGLARELVRKGHDVTVISSSSVMKKHDALSEETIEGIKVRRFSPVLPSSLLYMLGRDFDLVHMHHLGHLAPISSYATIRKKIKNIPTVFTVHGIFHDPYIVMDTEDPFSAGINGNIQAGFPFLSPWRTANWLAHLPLQADKITALTEWEKAELIKLGVNAGKISVVPNGIILEKYRKAGKNYFKKMDIEGKILLFVGQPTRRKGWKYFLEAMPEILDKFPEAKAVFIGYRQNKDLEDKCRNLGIENNARFLGFLPEEAKIGALKSSDLFVFPTLYEGFGITLIEAMASGLPVVTTDVAGNKEIIGNRKNGFLVKPKDSKAVAKACIELLESRKTAGRIRENNLKKAAQYDWKNVAKKYIEVYESVMR
ncbi:MAG: glycosyltransferase family 4 protein [Candidatus Aenigmarchaeota archaeon]|nr:glycosyltransferase family 4 protein [Candidatus Aenigmarchaeota archaeon]